MKNRFNQVFATKKPVIAMVHLGALPGSPLYNSEAGLDGLIEAARLDLHALQDAQVDAIMFGNENDRPYELKVDTASTSAAAYIIGQLKSEINIPFGVNMLWDPMATVALGAVTGAAFVREIFTGSYASDMGNWTADAGKAMRYRDQLNRKDMLMLFNVSAEFAYSLDQRSLADRAKSVAFSSIPDAILVSGQITGEAADLSELKMVKDTVSGLPILANTGVKHETVEEIFRIADGCIVGSALKYSGDTWQPVDPNRAKDFMKRVQKIRSQI